MNTYRMTYKTQCGITNVVVENGNTYAEAYRKAKVHVENKHSPMFLQKAEVKDGDAWIRC